MSPEAKQAAENTMGYCSCPSCMTPDCPQAAATAKLREELDVARSELGRRANENAKLREYICGLEKHLDETGKELAK